MALCSCPMTIYKWFKSESKSRFQLADGDSHAPHAKVTEAQDSPPIGENDALALGLASRILWKHQILGSPRRFSITPLGDSTVRDSFQHSAKASQGIISRPREACESKLRRTPSAQPLGCHGPPKTHSLSTNWHKSVRHRPPMVSNGLPVPVVFPNRSEPMARTRQGTTPWEEWQLAKLLASLNNDRLVQLRLRSLRVADSSDGILWNDSGAYT